MLSDTATPTLSRDTAAPTRCWEYRAIYVDRPDAAAADLDSLADDGWELVSVAASYAYLKRYRQP